MSTTKEDIKEWLNRVDNKTHSHMLVVCDTFDYDDYPVHVPRAENINDVMKRYSSENMQRIMEVYNYDMNLEDQLNSNRVWNIISPISVIKQKPINSITETPIKKKKKLESVADKIKKNYGKNVGYNRQIETKTFEELYKYAKKLENQIKKL